MPLQDATAMMLAAAQRMASDQGLDPQKVVPGLISAIFEEDIVNADKTRTSHFILRVGHPDKSTPFDIEVTMGEVQQQK
jgi:hypothetical protein